MCGDAHSPAKWHNSSKIRQCCSQPQTIHVPANSSHRLLPQWGAKYGQYFPTFTQHGAASPATFPFNTNVSQNISVRKSAADGHSAIDVTVAVALIPEHRQDATAHFLAHLHRTTTDSAIDTNDLELYASTVGSTSKSCVWTRIPCWPDVGGKRASSPLEPNRDAKVGPSVKALEPKNTAQYTQHAWQRETTQSMTPHGEEEKSWNSNTAMMNVFHQNPSRSITSRADHACSWVYRRPSAWPQCKSALLRKN